MKRTGLFLIALMILTIAVPSFAASATANLPISASVAANCLVTTTPVNFGAYDPVVTNAASPLNGSGAVNVACTKGASATIDLGNGAHYTSPSRYMLGGTSGGLLPYGLFKDNAYSQVWGSGLTGGTTAAYTSTSKAVTAVTVYGQIPAGQDVPVDASYTDTVLVTITF